MNRRILPATLAVICVIALTACGTAAPASAPSGNSGVNQASTSSPGSTGSGIASTLACGSGSATASETAELTEGPYFTPGSPERSSLLEEGISGTIIVISGYVYTTDCRPVANAMLDFWQADANGAYDNRGYNLRGHQFTDANGHYELTTVVPGLYPGRTEHIHVKVQAPGGKLITSQLFFPGVVQNDSDGIYNQSLLLTIQETSAGLQGRFNFVVPAS